MTKGQVSYAMLAIIGSVIIASGATVLGMVNYVSEQINPVSEQTQKNTNDISKMQGDLSWIRGALEAKGFRPILPLNMSSSTNTDAVNTQ